MILGPVRRRETFSGDLGAFLPRLELFRGAKPSTVRAFASRLRVQRFEAHEILPAQSEVEKCWWLVLEGLIERRVISAAGRITAVDIAAQGDIFGSLFSGCLASIQVESVALAPSVVGSMPCQDCRQILEHAPFFSQNLIRLLARRLREARELRAMAGEPARSRILWSLLMLYSKLGAELTLSRSEMAEVAAVTRETAIRALSPIEKSGFIRTRRGKIHIVQPQALAEELRR